MDSVRSGSSVRGLNVHSLFAESEFYLHLLRIISVWITEELDLIRTQTE